MCMRRRSIPGTRRGLASLILIGLQATLAGVSVGNGWTLIGLPGWVWLIAVVPEAALLLVLSWPLPRHRLEQMGRRRTVALVLVGEITAADALVADRIALEWA